MNNRHVNIYITVGLLVMSVAVIWINLKTAPKIHQPNIQYIAKNDTLLEQEITNPKINSDEQLDNTAQQGLDEFDYNISGEYSGEQPEIYVEFPININTATKEHLEQIPGIGEKTALKIIAYREISGGKISSIESLDDIAGIGAKTIEELKDYLYV